MLFAFAFPAMAAITVRAWAYFSFGDLKFVHSIFMGLGAMVVALLVNATLMMGRSVFQGMDRNAFKGIVIAALSFLGILHLRWNVVYIILPSGAPGALFFYISGAVVQGKAPKKHSGPAVDGERDMDRIGGLVPEGCQGRDRPLGNLFHRQSIFDRLNLTEAFHL